MEKYPTQSSILHLALFVVSFGLVLCRPHRRMCLSLAGFEIRPDGPIRMVHLDCPTIARYLLAERLETSSHVVGSTWPNAAAVAVVVVLVAPQHVVSLRPLLPQRSPRTYSGLPVDPVAPSSDKVAKLAATQLVAYQVKNVDGIDAVAFEKNTAAEISSRFDAAAQHTTCSVDNRNSLAGVGWDPSCVMEFHPFPSDSRHQMGLPPQMALLHWHHIPPFRANEWRWTGTKPLRETSGFLQCH